ncbi:MAG: DUF7305 domain-containing protein [Bacillota bacterium]
MNIKCQKGMAMIPVLIILIVVSILGTTVYYASAQEVLNSKGDENRTQAYYFARSGVEMAINLIKGGNCNNMSTGEEVVYYGSLDGDFTIEETSDYNIRFKIGLDEENYFIIDSVGIVRSSMSGGAQTQSDLKFKINKNDITGGGGNGGGQGGEGDVPIALFANESLNLKGSARVNGNVATNAINPGSVEFQYSCYINNGNLYIGPGADAERVVKFNGWRRGPDTNIPDGEILNLPSALSYPMPTFPAFPSGLEDRSNLSTNHGSHIISENGTGKNNYNFGYYDLIDIGGSSKITIKLDGKNRVIRVKNLEVTGSSDFILEGSGKLYLYVENVFTLSGSSKINYNGDPNSLVMFYQGSDALDFSGSTQFSGNIFAQNANVKISGSNNITGNIVTGGSSVEVSGSADAYPRILYSPNADVKVSGSGKVKGIVISNKCTVEGGNRDAIAAGSSLDTAFFNSLDWGAGGPPSLLLNSGQTPAQEQINWWQKGSWIKQ